ncbi:MAG: M56 family metallopeptidase [Acidobacteria bacterium]|nr:M56 family metallopeptidase [Acidobacteriota bacterium]
MMSFLLDSASTMIWLTISLNVLVKGTILLIAAALFGLVLQRASASARYLVWSSALFALMALPILSLLLPIWQIPLPSDLFPVAVSQPASTVSPVLPPMTPVDESDRQLFTPLSQDTETTSAHNSIVQTGENIPLQDPARLSRPVPLLTRTGPWLTWAVMFWFAGALALLVRLMVGWISAWWLVRRAQPIAEKRWKILLRDLGSQVGLAARVTLLQSDRAMTPMAWGLFRPVVLLPKDRSQWSDELRRMVLLHELAHVKRRDCLVQLIASMACSLYWINPMVWMAARRLRIERERACDDHVLSRGVRASDYAETLLQMARSLRSRSFSSMATVTMATSQLESRVLAILNPRLHRGALSRGAMALSIAGVACLALPLAAMQPAAGEKLETEVVGVPEALPASSSSLSDVADPQPMQASVVAAPPAALSVHIQDQPQEPSQMELAFLSSSMEPHSQPIAQKSSERRRDRRGRDRQSGTAWTRSKTRVTLSS